MVFLLTGFSFFRYLKAALLPNSQQQSLRTSLVSGALLKPVFGNSFSVPIPLNKLYTKTIQVNVLSVVGQREEIVVSEFATIPYISNIFSFQYFNQIVLTCCRVVLRLV